MNIINVDSARVTWLFPVSELNPQGRSLTDIFIELAERYNFKKAPKHGADIDPQEKGFTFNAGEFRNRDGIDVLVKLTVFGDGIVADGWSSTRDTEDFLKDVMQWLKEKHGLAIPSDRRVTILYLSELIVSAEKSPLALMSKLQELANVLSERTTKSGRANAGFMAGGFSLVANDHDNPATPAPYRFEIKRGSSPSENRYYASAALPTEELFEMLKDQERILTG